MIYSKRRFVLNLALCYFVLVFFSVTLELRLPRLGKRELILVLFVALLDLRLFCFVCFIFSSCLGWTAAYDCDFSLAFFAFLIPLFVHLMFAAFLFCVFPHLSFFCLGRAVLCDCGIFSVSSLIF